MNHKETKIRPTEGEFDNEEARSIFAKKYFWRQLLKHKQFLDFIAKLVPKFEIDSSFPQNQRNLYSEIRDWQKENNIFNNQHTHWLEFWIIHFIQFKARFPELKDEKFQNLAVRDVVPYYKPKIEGLYVFLYGDVKADEYIEMEREHAKDELNKTMFASLPPKVKNDIANEWAKLAESYTKEVKVNRKNENPNLKSTKVNPRYEQHFRWLIQVYFDRKQFSEVETAKVTDVANIST